MKADYVDEMPNTRSPDGRYALVVFDLEGTTACLGGLVTTDRKKCLALPSFMEKPQDREQKPHLTVLWSADSKHVAIHDSGPKHSKLQIYVLESPKAPDDFPKASKVEVPDLLAWVTDKGVLPSALRSSGQEPLRWTDNKHLVVEFRATTADGDKISKQVSIDLEKGTVQFVPDKKDDPKKEPAEPKP